MGIKYLFENGISQWKINQISIFFLIYIHMNLRLNNYTEHMITSEVWAGNYYPLVEIDDHLATDVHVNFTDQSVLRSAMVCDLFT